MIVLVAVLVVAVVALAVLWRRDAARVLELETTIEEARRRLQDREAALTASQDAAATAVRERDDALERANRARREATEVARRMDAEREARATAESARRDTEAERTRLEAALAEAEDAIASGSDEQVAELWDLALAGARRTWEVSVSPSPGLPSPLDQPGVDEFRCAVEIEIDAAREEAGALIDLDWTGDGTPPLHVAVRGLHIVQELIARAAKTTEEATLRVTAGETGVRIRMQGTRLDGTAFVPAIASEHAVDDGVWEIGC